MIIHWMRVLLTFTGIALACSAPASAQEKEKPANTIPSRPSAENAAAPDYLLAPGDLIRVTVFQSPDLSLETRVEEGGSISYPLIGSIPVAGSTAPVVEQRIAKALRDGGYMVAPHVTVIVVQVRGSQVTMLGAVARPGRYPLESGKARLTDLIAEAGGVAAGGDDVVVLTGTRDGKPERREIDLLALATSAESNLNVRLQPGDTLFVPRAPTFYIYGEVQKPGAYRLERGMSIMQALATGGGLSPKGTQRGLKVHRRGANGVVQVLEPKLDDELKPDDIIYVEESLF